jgi:very-short-patch-repair endonuclease
LRGHGWEVDTRVGTSRFRCDLAIRAAGASTYRLGVLLDHEHDYRNLSCWERDLARPAVLGAFGWRIERICARDWIRDQETVLQRLLLALGNDQVSP